MTSSATKNFGKFFGGESKLKKMERTFYTGFRTKLLDRKNCSVVDKLKTTAAINENK